jgi:hypothetical protein
MVLNTTFSNISVISWWSVLLMEETRVHRETHRPATSHWQMLSEHIDKANTGWRTCYHCSFSRDVSLRANKANTGWRTCYHCSFSRDVSLRANKANTGWRICYHCRFSRDVSLRATSPWVRLELKTLVVIFTDCTGSCKPNYQTLTTTMK